MQADDILRIHQIISALKRPIDVSMDELIVLETYFNCSELGIIVET